MTGKIVGIAISVGFTLAILYAVSRTQYGPTFGLVTPPKT
jgi:hypothetical protein